MLEDIKTLLRVIGITMVIIFVIALMVVIPVQLASIVLESLFN
jgi:hypothetical protein